MNKGIVRILALVLALLLAGGAVVSALIMASAEGQPQRDAYELSIELCEEEQALRVSQRLVYTNHTGAFLDSVLFCVYGNMFRRESALVYSSEDFETIFPEGFAPGGIAFTSVTVDGQAADWGVQGSGELFLRVGCALEAGQACEFGFEYVVLFSRNNASLGLGETDARFSGFYPVAAMHDGMDFVTNAPLSFARTLFAPAADYVVELLLPKGWEPACAGAVVKGEEQEDKVRWHAELTAHEFAFSCSRRWRANAAQTDAGTRIQILSNARGGARRALGCAKETLECFEAWFGPLPGGSITLAQSDYPLDGMSFDGLIWLSEALFDDAEALRRQIRFRIAQQYFGIGACVDPVADAWLSDAVSMYAAFLALEATSGEEAYLRALNREIVPALQLTMPGGLEITSAANLFSAGEYRLIVLDRGTAVLHELRGAMGREALIEGLRLFWQKGREKEPLGEVDFVDAIDAASGGSWASFLTDWLFNIEDYAKQDIDWLD